MVGDYIYIYIGLFKHLAITAYCLPRLLKVACVVNLKLAFTEWFFFDLVILIELCKSPISKFK